MLAVDFFTVETIWLQRLCVLFFIEVSAALRRFRTIRQFRVMLRASQSQRRNSGISQPPARRWSSRTFVGPTGRKAKSASPGFGRERRDESTSSEFESRSRKSACTRWTVKGGQRSAARRTAILMQGMLARHSLDSDVLGSSPVPRRARGMT